MIDRRQLVAGATLTTLLGGIAHAAPATGPAFGMVGKIKAKPGQRGELAELMLAGTTAMPGCLHYFVAIDVAHDDDLWVFEVWTDRAAHDASLQLPSVRDTIAKARPLIAGFESGAELNMLGGIGLGGR